MTRFRLFGAVALSLLVTTPAMAMQHVNRHRNASTARHAGSFDYRSVYGAYGFDRSGGFSDDFDRRNTFN